MAPICLTKHVSIRHLWWHLALSHNQQLWSTRLHVLYISARYISARSRKAIAIPVARHWVLMTVHLLPFVVFVQVARMILGLLTRRRMRAHLCLQRAVSTRGLQGRNRTWLLREVTLIRMRRVARIIERKKDPRESPGFSATTSPCDPFLTPTLGASGWMGQAMGSPGKRRRLSI